MSKRFSRSPNGTSTVIVVAKGKETSIRSGTSRIRSTLRTRRKRKRGRLDDVDGDDQPEVLGITEGEEDEDDRPKVVRKFTPNEALEEASLKIELVETKIRVVEEILDEIKPTTVESDVDLVLTECRKTIGQADEELDEVGEMIASFRIDELGPDVFKEYEEASDRLNATVKRYNQTASELGQPIWEEEIPEFPEEEWEEEVPEFPGEEGEEE